MRTVATTCCLLLSAAWARQGPPTARAEEIKLLSAKPLVVLSGIDSRMERTAYHRITSAAKLKQLWLAHLGKSADEAFRDRAPELAVNFDQCMVLAIFRCERGYSRGLEIASITEGNDALTLRFENLSAQVAMPLGGGAPVIPITPAYAFVVLPISPKPVVVEEATRELKADAPQWRERARLKADGAIDIR